MRSKRLFCTICTIAVLLTAGTVRAQSVRSESPRIFTVNLSSRGDGSLTRDEAVEIRTVLAQLSPRARKYLRYAFVGPRALFALFVTTAAGPPDYGTDSVVLNDCHAGPQCPHLCGTRFVYSENALIPLGPSGYACTQAWFWKD